MKSYEKESFFKNFLVFFSLLEILLVLLFSELYRTQKSEYLKNLFKTMQLCSYTYECPEFSFDFTKKNNKEKLHELYEEDAPYALFPILKSKKYNVKIAYDAEHYHNDIKEIQKVLWIKFILATLLLMAVAFFFTFYSLSPIRKALKLNDEFVKDILHDFNTPIASMVLNIKMYQEENPKNPFIKRIAHSIDTILLLQNNLKSFLHHSPLQNQKVDIAILAKTRMEFIQNLYPKLHFTFTQENPLVKYANEELLTRILDNILGNAAKYNKPQGEVHLHIEGDKLTIKDTGKGIKDISQVMQRYYKEQERGIGLGLHIVKKLTEELHIGMNIESTPGKGTTVTLDFKQLQRYVS